IDTLSVNDGGPGPTTLIDNVIRSKSGVSTGPVAAVTWGTGDLFSMGNIFTATSPTKASRMHSIQDQVVSRSLVNPNMPTLPGTTHKKNRQIYESFPGGFGRAWTGSSPFSPQKEKKNAAAPNHARPGVPHRGSN